MRKKTKRILAVVFALALCLSLQVTAFAEGDVASAVQSTWTAASGQIKTVTNNVILKNHGVLRGLWSEIVPGERTGASSK